MIIKNDEQFLRQECQEVHPEEVGELIFLLEKELDYANRLGAGGVGLAAIQIGICKKIAIVRLDPAHGLNVDLVNCQIKQGYDPKMFQDEGCLSFPGKIENTKRFQEVYITNNLIYPQGLIVTGLMAAVCQHEIDHFNSTLFFDHKFV